MRKVVAVGCLVVALILGVIWRWRGGGQHATQTDEQHGSGIAVHAGPRAPVAPASLAGRVTKAGGAGIAGATVAIVKSEIDLSSFSGGGSEPTIVTTDAEGAWTAPQVAPASYSVTAAAPGFLPVRHARITVGAGETKRGIDIELAPGGTIVRGTVSDIGGGGVAGARVSATGESFDLGSKLGGEAPYTTLSDGEGKYQLSLPDGPYYLSAAHDDYTRRYHRAVVAGKPLVVDFELVPGAVIRGQVIARDTGKPLAGAIVEASRGGRMSGMGRASASATSDAEGKFTLRHLSSGNLSVTAFGDGYASQQPSDVAVGIGEQVDGVRVLVDRALSISGHVVEKGTKKGIAGVTVGAGSFTGGGNEARSLEPSDKDGAFRIVGVRPGSYIVFAIGEDKMPEISKNVDVSTKDITDVVIELSAGATLTGRVDPPSKATIGVSLQGDIGIGNIMEIMRSVFVHGEADATGAFTLKHVPAGKFSLTAVTTEGPAGAIDITVTDVDQNGLVIPLEKRGTISGHVIDSNHAPVAGTRVSATEVGGGGEKKFSMAKMMSSARGGTTSGDDGSFRLVGLEPGKYVITARDEDDYSAFFAKKDKDKKPDEEIELAAGGERSGVVVTVEAKDGVISGTVVGSDGKAAADSWVAVRRELDLDPKMSARIGEYMRGQTGEPVLTSSAGKFVVKNLRKGKYTVIATGPRGASRAEKAGVATGDSITITLEALGTLSGHVTTGAAPVASYDLLCRGPAGRVDRHVDAADGAYALEHLAPGHYDCEVNADAGTATGTSDVPAGAATLEMSLVPWATLAGVVVNVLTGQPIAGVTPIVTQGQTSGRGMAAAFLGNGPTTDPSGRFSIDRVAAGSGSVALYGRLDMMKPLATKDFTAVQGQETNLGTIKVIPPRDGEAGTLGMATEIQGDALAVTLVQAGGPAASAGIVVGDKIISIDGKSVADLTPDIAQKVLSSGTVGAGWKLVLGLERGAEVTVTAAKW